jgi:hypothetical protein
MASPLCMISALAPVLMLLPTWLHLFPNTPPGQPKVVTPLYMHYLTERSYETFRNKSLQHL